jgi:hypothetical protein
MSTLHFLMACTKAKIGLAALLAASVTTPLVFQYQTNHRLRDEVAHLRNELGTRPSEQTVASDTSEVERLRREHEELLRLRGQVTQLRQQLANGPKAPAIAGVGSDRANSRRSVEEVENARKLLAKSPEIPMIQSNEFTNAGYATPLASFHTINWAKANRDTNAMLSAIGLEPEARTRADELFAQMPETTRQKYGSVDALLVDWAMNLADDPEGYRVLSQRQEGSDSVTLTVQFQYPSSRVRENEASFYRDQDGGWRRAVPAGVIAKMPSVINNQAQSSPVAK